MYHKMVTQVFIFQLLLLSVCNYAIGQTTGKIVGRVTDANTGEALAGTNITIDETLLGGSTDLEGEFYIINIPPGKYTVRVQMIGYETRIIKDVSVSQGPTKTNDHSG